MNSKIKYSVLTLTVLVILALTAAPLLSVWAADTTITISGTPWGVSTQYIGAVEGSAKFNINDLTDLGINTYRVYGGTSRWEPVDDDGVFGSPTIAQIKANPSVINWAAWDSIFDNPPNGSAYFWSGSNPYVWQGSDRQLFDALKANNILPVVTLRTTDNNYGPAWANAQLNPPTTQAAWDEWWEHVFATVYFFNVRNNYGVDYWQIHNEPSSTSQGWMGTVTDYENLAQYTYDAIKYVYDTYLPGRTYHIMAPDDVGDANWLDEMLVTKPNTFDIVDFHPYDDRWGTFTGRMQAVYATMNNYGYGNRPVWATEWGSWEEFKTDTVAFNISTILYDLILGSRPGNTHLEGSHIFGMYDWGGADPYSAALIHGNYNQASSYMPSYYAMRMGIRGLQGGRTTYQTTPSNSKVVAITTNKNGLISLLVDNTDTRNAHTIDANLSPLISSGTGTMWEFSAANMDVVVGNPTLSAGHVVFTVPAQAAVLLQFTGVPPTSTPTTAPTNTPTAGPSPTPTKTNTPAPTNTPPPSGTNLALNKPVTVSSFNGSKYVGPKAVDGSTSTYWRTVDNSTLPAEWIVVDMGSVMNISQVKFAYYSARYPTAYTVDVSTDNVNWTTVVTVTNGTGNVTHTFASTPARYVRQYSTAWLNSPTDRERIAELEIYQ